MEKKRGRGRPILYGLNGNQVRAVVNRLERGESANHIAGALGIHPFAVIRVRRNASL